MPRAASTSHTASDTPRERKSVTCLNSFGRRDRVSEEGDAISRERGPSALRSDHGSRRLRTLGRSRSSTQAQPVLELRDPQLELVPLLARHEPELAREVLHAPLRPLAHAHRVAAPARRRRRRAASEPRRAAGRAASAPVERVALGESLPGSSMRPRLAALAAPLALRVVVVAVAVDRRLDRRRPASSGVGSVGGGLLGLRRAARSPTEPSDRVAALAPCVLGLALLPDRRAAARR